MTPPERPRPQSEEKRKEKLQAKAKKLTSEQKEKIQETITKTKQSAGKLGERGYSELRKILSAIKEDTKKAHRKFQEKTTALFLQTGRRLDEIGEQVDQLANEYNNDIDSIMKPLVTMLGQVLGGRKYLNEADLEKFLRLQRSYRESFDGELLKHKELREEFLGFMKQLRSGKPLTPVQLEKLINFVRENDLHKVDNVENNRIAFMLNMMAPKQRMDFMRALINSPQNSQHTPKLIDSFTKSGILSVRQGEELMKEALAAPANSGIIPAPEKMRYLQQFNDGTYQRAQNMVALQKEKTIHELQERFYQNPALRYLSTPSIIGMFGVLWGVSVAGLNLLVNRGTPTAETMYGLGAIFAGTLLTSHGSRSDRRGAMGLDAPYVPLLQTIFQDNKRMRMEFKRYQNLKTFTEVYNNKPLHQYFKNGGFKKFIDEFNLRHRTEKNINQKNLTGIVRTRLLTFDELIKMEQKSPDSNRRARIHQLQSALSLMPGLTHREKVAKFNELLERLAAASNSMNVKSQGRYSEIIGSVHQSQGLRTRR